jgi:hypothetical protein
MNLVKYEQNGLEFWVDESTSLAYAHLSGIARMLGMAPTNGTLRRRLELLPKSEVKTAEIHTSNGIKLVPLYPSSVVFRLALEFNSELAEAMGNCGANVYMLGQAGYQVKVAEASAPIVDPVLLPYQQAVVISDAIRHVSDNIRHITDTLSDHPRLAQILVDNSMNTIIEKQPAMLPAKSRRGVAEIATEMGYKVDQSNRTKLGKSIAKQGYEPVKEPRLCNGVMAPINCYEDTPELRESIANYFK